MPLGIGKGEGGKTFFDDVLLVKFMHLVLSRIPRESYVGDTGHCWCASCYSCDVCQAVLLPFVDHRLWASFCFRTASSQWPTVKPFNSERTGIEQQFLHRAGETLLHVSGQFHCLMGA